MQFTESLLYRSPGRGKNSLTKCDNPGLAAGIVGGRVYKVLLHKTYFPVKVIEDNYQRVYPVV